MLLTKIVSPALLCAFSLSVANAQPSTLLEHNGLVVTEEDVSEFITSGVPDQEQAKIWRDRSQLSEIVANIYVNRQLAKEFDELDVDDSLAWRVDYEIDRAKSRGHLVHAVEEALANVDLEALAHETYDAYPERFERGEQVKAAHILIATDERSDDEARALAEQVREKALAGDVAFTELAAEFSDDPSAERNQGDLGFFGKGQMVPEFEEAAFALDDGEISAVVKTDFGYHVIKQLDYREASLRSFDSVKRSLIEEEKKKVEQEVRERELERVRSKDVNVDHDAVEALVRD